MKTTTLRSSKRGGRLHFGRFEENPSKRPDPPHPLRLEMMGHDAEADMLSAEASSAICVQRFDDSRNSAIHITYRISLRSSSLREPRYPLLRVVFCLFVCCTRQLLQGELFRVVSQPPKAFYTFGPPTKARWNPEGPGQDRLHPPA